MRAAYFNEPRSIAVTERPDPVIREPTDAIVRVVLSCVCGSDLWYYRGDSPFAPGPIGHEFIGVVEDVGSEVRTIAKGDFVISPFAFSDGTCPHCWHGITSACSAGGFYPSTGDGGQGEGVRVPLADGTLVPVPGSGHSDQTMASLLTLSDVLATGHHAAVCAGVKAGGVIAVVGDGAVGLSGVLASSRLGAERVIALSRNPVRQQLAREFGATEIVEARGEEATEAVKELTDGVGADAVLECVGTAQAMQTAISIARPGSMVGYVGVPHGVELPIGDMFFRNVGVRGGPHRSAPTYRSFCPTCSMSGSTLAACSTSRPISTVSRRRMRPWTSAARSSHCSGSGRSDP
jgi:threonine dehydrogenase-like Zn-dependent dehydrogenase